LEGDREERRVLEREASEDGRFSDVWTRFESSLGLDRIPEPTRSLVLAAHDVKQEVVVGDWETMLQTDPRELQAWIDDEVLPKLDVPCLGVFGRPIGEGDRERFARLPDVQLEEWVGDGHFLHLVDPDRFTDRIRRFVDHCTATNDQATRRPASPA